MKREEQEQVFLRRLINDGHGSGEDRRLVNIIKNVTKLCLDPNVDPNNLSTIIIKDINNAIDASKKHADMLEFYDRTIAALERNIQDKKFATRLKQVTMLPHNDTADAKIKELEDQIKDLMKQLERRATTIKNLIQKCQGLAEFINEDEDFT